METNHKPRSIVDRSLRLFTALAMLLAMFAPFARPAHAATSITEYPLPTSNNQPAEITTGPDGALWFTEYNGNKIGRISTDGVLKEYPLPTAGSMPYGITKGPDDALWFTEYNGNKIGRISTDGVLKEYLLPTGKSGPLDITTGPDDALWFTEYNGNKIGRISTDGVFQEYPIPTATSIPYGITTGPDGALWFTEIWGNKIGRISTDGVFQEYPIPTAGSYLQGITTGPDDALWFTEMLGNKIGRITTDGVIQEYPLPIAGSMPYDITTGPDGALWFTENTGNRIGRISTDGVFQEYPIPTARSGSYGITTGPDGALWFTESSSNKIGRLSLYAPEIDVSGNDQPIASGDTTPAINDGSDFGSVVVGKSVTHTFTITNSGDAALNLTGTPKIGITNHTSSASTGSATASIVTLQQADAFGVVNLPSSPIAPGSSTTFDVAFAPSAAGAYSATVSIANDDSNENPYTFDITGVAEIAPTITSDVPPSGAYGTAYSHTFEVKGAPAPTLSLSGTLPAGLEWDAAKGSISGTPTQAGSFPNLLLTASNGIGPNATQSFTLTVAKADQAITIDIHAPGTATYKSDFIVAATGGKSGAPVSYSVDGVCSINGTTITMTSGTGICTVTYTQAGDTNYLAASTLTDTVIAQKASQSISFAAPEDTTYGAAATALGASANSGLPVSYWLGKEDECLISNGTVVATGAGDCTITASQAGDENYDAASPVVRGLHVNKAKLTVKAADQTRRVGQGNPTLEVLFTGFVGEDNEEVLDSKPTASTTADESSSADVYEIIVSEGSDDDYEFEYVKGALTVTLKDVPVVAWNNPAAITYGGKLSDAQLNASATFADEQVEGTFSYTPSLETVLNAGNGQVLKAVFTPNDTVNYESVSKEVQLDVLKAALTVIAEDKSIVAGEALPTLTVRYEGFVNSDDVDDLNSQASANATATSSNAAGSYAIVASGAADDNYTISYVEGTLTIAPGAASSIEALAGEGHQAVVDTAFGTRLQAKVSDKYGNPIAGVQVRFVAPSEGASGTFASDEAAASTQADSNTALVTTDDDGVATSPIFTANEQAGSYVVQAVVEGITEPLEFHLSNTASTSSGSHRVFLIFIRK